MPLEGHVEIQLLREPNTIVAKQTVPILVNARATETLSVDAIVGSFHDVNYAYRFGPPSHHVAVASWLHADGTVLSESFHFTRARDPERVNVQVRAEAKWSADGRCTVELESAGFLHSVRLSGAGILPNDNYFHLLPGRIKQVNVRLAHPVNEASKPVPLFLEALNLLGEIAL
jgi:beta-mannosidase